MSGSATPQPGDVYLKLSGDNSYVEVRSIADYSVSTTGALTVAVWIRPATLNFRKVEPHSDYIHWLGKGDAAGPNGNQEWTFRMYNQHDRFDDPPRSNRISFYLFNPEGGLGVGSYVQQAMMEGEWVNLAAVIDAARIHFYRDGRFMRCDTYRGPGDDSCEIHYQPPPNETLQLVIDPQAGQAPLRLGTKDLGSFFEGGLARVRLWNRALTKTEIARLYAADAAPRDGLVAEFLLDADTGATAPDSAQGNDGTVVNGAWTTQH